MYLWDKRNGRMVFTSCIHPVEFESAWSIGRRAGKSMAHLLPRDYSWHILVFPVALAVFNIVLFVRWWVG